MTRPKSYLTVMSNSKLFHMVLRHHKMVLQENKHLVSKLHLKIDIFHHRWFAVNLRQRIPRRGRKHILEAEQRRKTAINGLKGCKCWTSIPPKEGIEPTTLVCHWKSNINKFSSSDWLPHFDHRIPGDRQSYCATSCYIAWRVPAKISSWKHNRDHLQ